MARLLRFGYRQARAFFHGMGSALCLFPAHMPPVRGHASDMAAIAEDFARVGNDIRAAMNRIATERPGVACAAEAPVERNGVGA